MVTTRLLALAAAVALAFGIAYHVARAPRPSDAAPRLHRVTVIRPHPVTVHLPKLPRTTLPPLRVPTATPTPAPSPTAPPSNDAAPTPPLGSDDDDATQDGTTAPTPNPADSGSAPDDGNSHADGSGDDPPWSSGN